MSRLSLFEPCTCLMSPQSPDTCESLTPMLPAGLPGQAPLVARWEALGEPCPSLASSLVSTSPKPRLQMLSALLQALRRPRPKESFLGPL